MESGLRLEGAMRARYASRAHQHCVGPLRQCSLPSSLRRALRGGNTVSPQAEPQRFADFLGADPAEPQRELSADEKAQELIDRTAAVLAATQAALAEVRRRDPADSRYRLSGPTITAGPTIATDSTSGGGTAGGVAAVAAGRARDASGPSPLPAARSSFLAWQADDDESEEEQYGFSGTTTTAATGGSRLDIDSSMGSGGGGGALRGPAGIDAWFGDKIDTASVGMRAAPALQPSDRSVQSVEVLDRPMMPASLDFGAPEAPAESRGATIFPAALALRFQSEESQQPKGAPAARAAPVQEAEGLWERTSGEEFGPGGYWYRWTEVAGRDASGAVAWSERWWEASDWRGMKEMGAEKWGNNARGDAWRETWREAIGFDAANGQPTVERSAHKWARNGGGQEWEEKWGESYCSGGRAEKFADKWGREGGDVWHEKWGESYDGRGGCVKYTDRWAERPGEGGYGLTKWGDKWEERFKDGKGSKAGETWSEGAGGERYNRWWGENHFGDGHVQKFGHSTEGDHWDVTEPMDTYYNPIPHFGYDLALAHSPQLRGVPTLPRDAPLEAGGGGLGGGDAGGGGGGLSDIL